MIDIYKEIVLIQEKGEKAALVTLIGTSGSTPREQGTKMLVKEDGTVIGSIGGGKLELLIQKEAIKSIQDGKNRTLHYDLSSEEASEVGMICGGVADVLIEPILPVPVLYIFGAGHISIPLSVIAKMVGFKVVIIDDRVEYANKSRFPDVDHIIIDDFKSVFSKIKINNHSYIVIVTRGHAYDELVLEEAIKTDATYIGMIGSKKKVNTVYSHLIQKGINKSKIESVHAPIGLEIDAETPEEIAVSIMGEIIKHRRSLEN